MFRLTIAESIKNQINVELHSRQVLRHEESITDKINELMNNIVAAEQVEEETAVGDSDILSKLRLIGKDSSGFFFLHADLGKLSFSPAARAQAV